MVPACLVDTSSDDNQDLQSQRTNGHGQAETTEQRFMAPPPTTGGPKSPNGSLPHSPVDGPFRMSHVPTPCTSMPRDVAFWVIRPQYLFLGAKISFSMQQHFEAEHSNTAVIHPEDNSPISPPEPVRRPRRTAHRTAARRNPQNPPSGAFLYNAAQYGSRPPYGFIHGAAAPPLR